MIIALGVAALNLALLLCLFAPLERVFPARPEQRTLRPELGIDLVFFLGQYLVFAGVVLSALNFVDTAITPLSLATWLSLIHISEPTRPY